MICSCVCQVLQFGAPLDHRVSGHPAGAARRRHPRRQNGAQRARARRQARRSFPCAGAPFWHSPRLRRAGRWDDSILLVSFHEKAAAVKNGLRLPAFPYLSHASERPGAVKGARCLRGGAHP
jgi:hypothetical protein